MPYPVTILIADDESLVRKGLRHILSAHPNYRVIGEASNGQEAVDLVRTLKPDILLIDVRMPLMDGLQAIERINEMQLSVIPIILSGHSDFAYAQKALRLGVYEYLLKPADPEELILAIKRVMQFIIKGNEQRGMTSQLQRQLSKNRQTFVEKFFNELIHSEYIPSEIEEKLKLLDIKEDSAIIFLLSPDNWYQLKTTENKSKYIELYNNTKQLLQSFLDMESQDGMLLLRPDNGYIILILYTSTKLNIQEFASRLKEWVSNKIDGISFSIAIGTEQPLANLDSSFTSAASRLKSRLLIGHGAVIDNDFYQSKLSTAYPTELIKEVEQYIKLGNNELAQSCLSNVYDKIAAIGGFSPDSWFHLCLDIIEICYKAAKEYNIVHLFSVVDKLPEIANISTVADMQLWINTYIRQVTEKISECESDTSWEIKNALSYINEHFAENISLAQVAHHVRLSPNYLGQLLKRHTGKKFTDILSNKRMSEAKILLHEPDLNISEVSFRVGFDSQRYFSQVFTKLEGMTPSEYRRKIYKSTH